MTKQAQVDIVIFGGGIAGLWLLARLRERGYSVVLFESGGLGGVQTIASQGIIHGGTKYALSGNLTEAAQAIGDMPGIWRNCLAGHGELDLSRVRVLAEHQYLWSTKHLGSRLAGFFASKVMRSRSRPVEGDARPDLFRNPAFSGDLYRLDEPVLDIPSLVNELVRQYGEACFALEPGAVRFSPSNPGHLELETPTGMLRLQAGRLILAAGAGNEALLQRLGREQPTMQRRPLHMVMARGCLPGLYAHCLGASTQPRLTVTSYPLGDGERVWHLGGEVAETGVQREAATQIIAGRAELATLLPWLELTDIRWASRRIDRAELATAGGKRPESYCVHSDRGVITLWPTKLAFAPHLAGLVLEQLEQAGVLPTVGKLATLQGLPRPPLAQPPWEEETWS